MAVASVNGGRAGLKGSGASSHSNGAMRMWSRRDLQTADMVMLESMDTTIRVAVITGASQGIGRRTAEVLAGKGYALALNDIQSTQGTRDVLSSIGATAIEVLGDVSSETAVERMVRDVQQHYGRVDVLVNNAGISFIRRAEDTGADEWRRVLEVNLTGPFLLCRAFGKLMLQQREGAIVNVASVAGLAGIGDRAAYNASKHGLIGLTRTLASEWGGRGVRCNAVCPGWVKTEMDEADQAGGFYSDADIENRVPMARFARPNEIAEAIAFLADPKLSGFVNGMELRVDGGWLADGSWDRLRIDHRAVR
jgi:NAD(P)-dependent dehydrogenase (short-subunit alcohol dehydrogenase family)